MTGLRLVPGPNERGTTRRRRALAALNLARRLVYGAGYVTGEDLDHMREAGYGESEIADIVSGLGLGLLAVYQKQSA